MRESLSFAFELTASSYGGMALFFLVSYTLMQVPSGIFLDKFGTRRTLLYSILISSVGNLILAISLNFPMLCLGRMIIGIGCASAFCVSFKIAYDWFSPQALPKIVGITCAIGVAGASFAGAPIVMLEELLGWRNTFAILALVGVLTFIFYYLYFEDKYPTENSNRPKLIHGLRSILSNSQIWLLGAYGLALYTPVSVLADLWGPSFVKETFGTTSVKAAFITSFLFYGNAVGSFLIGWIMHRFISLRAFFLFFSISLGLVLIYTVWGYIPNTSVLFCLFFSLGFFTSPEGMIFPLGARLVQKEYVALTSSILNFYVTAGAMFMQPLIGVILDFFWNGEFKDGIPYYSVHNYKYSLTALIIWLSISVSVAFWIRGRTKEEESPIDQNSA